MNDDTKYSGTLQQQRARVAMTLSVVAGGMPITTEDWKLLGFDAPVDKIAARVRAIAILTEVICG